MTAFTAADTLHRLIKHALDSGAAASIAEAEALFAGYRLALRIDDAHARDRHHQAALLTAVALARRVFLGGVTVAVLPDTPLLAPLAVRSNAGRGRRRARRRHRRRQPRASPLIDIGGGPCARSGAVSRPRAVRGLARRNRSGRRPMQAGGGADHGAGAHARRRARRE